MRLPAILCALASVLAAAVLWLVLGGDPAQAGVSEAKARGGRPEALPPRPGPEAAATMADPAAEGRAEVELRLRPVAEVIPVAPLAVEITSRGLPIRGARARVVAGAQAPGGDPAARGPAMVRIELPDGSVFFRRVDLRARAVDVDVGVAGPLSGRVLGRDGAPLSALVWCGEGLHWTETDGDGRFRVEQVRGSSGVPVVVVAPGRASTVVFVDPRDELEVRLGEGSELDVGVLGVGASFERAVVVPAGERQTALLSYPFFLDAHEFAAVRASLAEQAPWQARSGCFGVEGGHTRIVGLPLGAKLRAVGLADGRAPVRSDEVVLGAAGNRAHLAARRPAADASGTVRRGSDTGALATSGRSARLGARKPGPWMLCPEAMSAGPIARVDAEGRFRIEAGAPIELWGHEHGVRSSGLRLMAPADQRPWSLPPALADGVGGSSFEVVGPAGPFAVRVDGGPWRPSADGVALTEGWRRPALLDIQAQLRVPGQAIVERSLSTVLAVGPTALDLR